MSIISEEYLIGKVYLITELETSYTYVGSTFQPINLRFTNHINSKHWTQDKYNIRLLDTYGKCTKEYLRAHENIWIYAFKPELNEVIPSISVIYKTIEYLIRYNNKVEEEERRLHSKYKSIIISSSSTTCEYCHKNLCNLAVLKRHQQTSKSCLDIQINKNITKSIKKVTNGLTCEYCNKVISNKSALKRHQLTAKFCLEIQQK